MKVSVFIILILAMLLGIPSFSLGKELPRIVVWDLAAGGNISPTHAQDLTLILVSEISKLKKFEVYSQENVRTLAGWTEERMRLGCTDTKCLIALGQMDVAKLISGRVGKIGNRYSISLNLFDTQNTRAENAISEFCQSEDELIELVQIAIRRLLGEQTEERTKLAEERKRVEEERQQLQREMPDLKKQDLRIGPDLKMVIASSKDAVVHIYGIKQNKQQTLGTGFFIDEKGYILTNHHILEGMDIIHVKLVHSEFIAEPVGSDRQYDIALIRIPGFDLSSFRKNGETTHLKIAQPGLVREGQWVVALGNPFGPGHVASAGVIVKKNPAPKPDAPQWEKYYLQTDAAIHPGNSGGPLLNLNGNVVGLNTAMIRGQDINFALSSEFIGQFLSRYHEVPFYWQSQYDRHLDSPGQRWQWDAAKTEELKNALCSLSDYDDAGKRPLGSCFVISSDGYILTNHHVVKDKKAVNVRFADGSEFRGSVMGADEKIGISLLKIPSAKAGHKVLRLGDSGSLKAGDWVIAVGNPSGFENNFSSGIISASGNVSGIGAFVDFLQTDAAIDARNDGGPLLNLSGEVIGINSALFKESQGIGFAIPVNIAKSSIQQLKEKGKVTRSWLGVSIQAITPERARSMGLKGERGVLVQDVTKGGPAEKANIKPGDVILEFDGKALNEMNELPRLVAAAPVGEKLPVKVLRDGRMMEVMITIGRLPDGIE